MQVQLSVEQQALEEMDDEDEGDDEVALLGGDGSLSRRLVAALRRNRRASVFAHRRHLLFLPAPRDRHGQVLVEGRSPAAPLPRPTTTTQANSPPRRSVGLGACAPRDGGSSRQRCDVARRAWRCG